MICDSSFPEMIPAGRSKKLKVGNMVSPLSFKTEYVLTQSVPYECADEGTKGTNASKGILQTGRVVWLESGAIGSETANRVRVYADGIGIVLLEQRFIRRIE